MIALLYNVVIAGAFTQNECALPEVQSMSELHPAGMQAPPELKMVRDPAVGGTSHERMAAKAGYVNSLHPSGRFLFLSAAWSSGPLDSGLRQSLDRQQDLLGVSNCR